MPALSANEDADEVEISFTVVKTAGATGDGVLSSILRISAREWRLSTNNALNVGFSANDAYTVTTVNSNNAVDNADWARGILCKGPSGRIAFLFNTNAWVKTINIVRVGIRGNSGQEGPQGPEGERGEQGPLGNQGPVGNKGATGDRGPTGTQGIEGDQGPVGNRGPTGNPGRQGPVGEQGPDGDKGLKGDPGDKGDTGDTGPVGNQGPVGDRGPTGTQGAEGVRGEQGPIGNRGPDGRRGATGNEGPVGAMGAVGNQGPRGDKGEKGDTGDKGPTGDAGNDPRLEVLQSLGWRDGIASVSAGQTTAPATVSDTLAFTYATVQTQGPHLNNGYVVIRLTTAADFAEHAHRLIVFSEEGEDDARTILRMSPGVAWTKLSNTVYVTPAIDIGTGEKYTVQRYDLTELLENQIDIPQWKDVLDIHDLPEPISSLPPRPWNVNDRFILNAEVTLHNDEVIQDLIAQSTLHTLIINQKDVAGFYGFSTSYSGPQATTRAVINTL